MPPKKFTADTAPTKAKPPVKRESLDQRRTVLQTTLITKLSEQLGKLGGHLGLADEMAHLHKPQGYTKTGIYPLDILLSGKHGGVPHGRFIEIFGPESSGKSALAEFVMSAFHRSGGIVHHADTEMTRDDQRIEKCYGLTTEQFIDVDAPDLESIWDYAYGLVKVLQKEANPPPNLLVLDSLAQTPARCELEEKKHEDAHVASQARANSKGVRKTVRLFSSSSVVFLFINQLRDKIGGFGHGDKTDTPGGKALKYAYSIRLKVARIGAIKSGEQIVGQMVKITSKKNKHAPPLMDCELVLSYKTGIDVDASNFLWLQKHRAIIPFKGRKFQWADGTGPFTQDTFAEWCVENKVLVDAKVQELTDSVLSSVSDSESSSQGSSTDDDEDA